MKAIVGRSASIVSMVLVALIIFSATPSNADTPLIQSKPSKETLENRTEAKFEETVDAKPLIPATSYVATAYSLRGRTASGRMVSRGLIAADPRILPLGSRVKLEVPGYRGEYLVADTGGLIKGKRIDIGIPSSREAMRFGRRTVKLTVLSYGAKRTRRTARS